MNSNRNVVFASGALSAEAITCIREKILTIFTPCCELNVVENLCLVCSEHLTNILKHNSEMVQVSVRVEGDNTIVEISDNGTDVSSLIVASPSINNLTLNNPLPESGMGLSLIKHLAPDLTYVGKSNEQSSNLMTLNVEKKRPAILVVDDDAVQVSVLEAMLQDQFKVFTFIDPHEALSFLNNHSVDVILCDVKMPTLDGFGFRKKLLAVNDKRLIPFVFLTGDDAENSIEKASTLQIDDYVQKPINKAKLLNTIKRIRNRTVSLKHAFDAKLNTDITESLWAETPTNIGPFVLNRAYRVAERGGGDFLFSVSFPGRTLFILGDMMGHGEQAKFFSFAVSGYLHGICQAMSTEPDVSLLMTSLSDAMASSTVLSRTLVTCLAVQVWENGRIEIVGAGHPAPWKVTRQGDLEAIVAEGPLPGLSYNQDYTAGQLSLRPGESLVCFTDGLIESALGQKEQVDMQRITAAFQQARCSAIGVDTEQLLNQLCGARTQDDDTTVFCCYMPG